jgi:5-formyltetrahydrofolate cyclo-ligase
LWTCRARRHRLRFGRGHARWAALGKGEGYSDLEFAILRELGHPPVPVATTVHDLQVVTSVPRDPTDQPLSVIATPTHAIRIKRPSAAPTGIDWTRLSPEDLRKCRSWPNSRE